MRSRDIYTILTWTAFICLLFLFASGNSIFPMFWMDLFYTAIIIVACFTITISCVLFINRSFKFRNILLLSIALVIVLILAAIEAFLFRPYLASFG